ncbi:MAG: tRNA-dihydrouridine synthase family protein [Muribaculaceae bacterium]|nr:tRNA-dihydrouridine synthase family protein [Muribaculaceae bacterium]
MIDIYSAPLQGFTEAIWRRLHNNIFGGISKYYAPFMRIEHGEIRKKDIRDIAIENNQGLNIIPQILASKPDNAKRTTEHIISLGYKEIDINIGCPFPPITNKKQGAGMLCYPELVIEMLKELTQYKNDIQFSIKARLGLKADNELINLIPEIEKFKPTELTIHPRIAKQQYTGDILINQFDEIYNATSIPIVYNGDILTVDNINSIVMKYPKLKAIMIGRGLLYNPALAREYQNGKKLEIAEFMTFSNQIYNYYKDTLQGDSHILAKIKPFWNYAPDFIDHKTTKLIKKSSSLAKYENAVNSFIY